MLSKSQKRSRSKQRRAVRWVREQLCSFAPNPMLYMLQSTPHPDKGGRTLLDWVESEMWGPWNRQVKAARLVVRLMRKSSVLRSSSEA